MKFEDFIELHRGYDLPKKQRKNGQVPVIASTGINGTHNVAKIKGPGVVTGRSGSIGKVQYIKDDFWPLNTTLYVSDFKGNNPKFVAYWLERFDLKRFSSGSAVPTLNRNELANVEICVPNREEQDKIVAILEPFEKKIELNQEINDNLFKLAKIHFDRQLDSENIKFSQISTIQNGYAFKSKEYVDTNELMILRTKNINDNHLFSKNDVVYISKELFDKYKKFSFSAFDTVLVMVGASIGKTGFVTSNMTPSLQNQNMWRFRPKMSNIPGLLIFQYVNYINKHIIGSATGSARSFYRKKLFSEFEVPRINSTNYIYFDTLQREIDHLNTENEILYRIKHSLLNHYF
ncbi:restriction endonuclease subunit S [Lactobacillus delbrueckii]|uniref:restriction endonuclease subunit S n=1 Tax=Lactobacillus delbrueckii TaxID=1584 RepID=UPI0030E8508F